MNEIEKHCKTCAFKRKESTPLLSASPLHLRSRCYTTKKILTTNYVVQTYSTKSAVIFTSEAQIITSFDTCF